MSELTIKQHIDAAIAGVMNLQIEAGLPAEDQRNAGRCFSLAITHLEDAKMRVTRGLALNRGVFNEVDLQNPEGIERAVSNFEANVTGQVPGLGRSAESDVDLGGGGGPLAERPSDAT